MIGFRTARGFALFVAISVVSCSPDEGTDAPDPSETSGAPEAGAAPTADPREIVVEMSEVPWAVNLEVNLDDMILQRSGLYVQILRDGQGRRSAPGDSMDVHYRVWLPNGTLIDASYEHDPPDPLEMVLGVTQLIDGWTQGVSSMRVGERRRLVLPHELAYGPRGHPAGIPPYSPLLYEVELVSLRVGEPPPPVEASGN